MRPRTKIPIPEPTGSEFENFDRFVSMVLSKAEKRRESPPPKKKRGRTKHQDRGRLRLPRP